MFVSGFVQSDFAAIHAETLVGTVSGRDIHTKNRKTEILAHTGSVHNRYVNSTYKHCTCLHQ